MHRTASGALGHTNYVVIISLVFFIALAQSGHGTVESLPSRAVEAGPRRAQPRAEGDGGDQHKEEPEHVFIPGVTRRPLIVAPPARGLLRAACFPSWWLSNCSPVSCLKIGYACRLSFVKQDCIAFFMYSARCTQAHRTTYVLLPPDTHGRVSAAISVQASAARARVMASTTPYVSALHVPQAATGPRVTVSLAAVSCYLSHSCL